MAAVRTQWRARARTRWGLAAFALCASAFTPAVAAAQEQDATATEERTAQPVARAEEQDVTTTEERTAQPAQVSGIRIEPEPEPTPWMWARRGLLFVPRWTFRIATAPPRLLIWVVDRYALEQRYKRIFFNADGTFGVYPFVDVVSGFGATMGVAFVDYDHLDRRFGSKVSARFGGRSGQMYQIELGPNGTVGRWGDLRIMGRYAMGARARFYGIGNADEGDVALGTLLDPVDPAETARADYRHRDWVGAVRATIFPRNRFKLKLETRVLDRTYNPDDSNSDLAEPIEERFATDDLIGYSSGLRNVYSDVQAILDLRHIVASYDNPPVEGTGWFMTASVGYARGLSSDPSRYVRYSADLLRYFDLYHGDRVLILRARLLGVAGADDAIPFDSLPYLGGRVFLRGYPSQRFRDRLSLLTTAEYQYPINHYLSGYLFADGGRVYRDYGSVELEGLRIGFGGGLDYRSVAGTIARLSVSSSIDGSIFFNFGFEEVPDVHTR